MRLHDVGGMVFGGLAVYVAMAACSGEADTRGVYATRTGDASGGTGGAGVATLEAGPGGQAEGGPNSGGGSGGATEVEAGQFVDADGILDALLDPVPEASAQTPPETATEMCDKLVAINDSGVSYVYAEHAFQGKSVNDLAGLRTVAHYVAGAMATGWPPAGYEYQLGAGAIVRDGSAIVFCGVSSSPSYDRVTFILPAL